MRTSHFVSSVVAAGLAFATGCQTSSPGGPMLGMWPWGAKSNESIASTSAPPAALPQKPSATATPGYGTVAASGAVASSPYSSGAYPQTATPQGGGYSAYPGTQPASYNVPSGAHYVAANPTGSGYGGSAYGPAAAASPSGGAASPQAGPYDASYGPYSAAAASATTPAGYVTSGEAARYNPSAYGAADTGAGYAASDELTPEGAAPRVSRYTGAGRYGESSAAAPSQPAADSSSANRYLPGSTGYQPGATDYQPGDTGYDPGQTGYDPGATDYSPPGVQRYQPPAGGAASYGDEPSPESDPHYRPGGTSDYVPAREGASASPTSVPGSTRPAATVSRYGAYPSDAPASVTPPASSYVPPGSQYDSRYGR
jgi:serine/threonine-protein kinase